MLACIYRLHWRHMCLLSTELVWVPIFYPECILQSIGQRLSHLLSSEVRVDLIVLYILMLFANIDI